MRKQLPSGVWITFALLHPETSDHDFQAMLADCHIALEVDRISIDQDRSGRSAFCIVSLPKQEVCNLFARALMLPSGQDRKLHGRAVVPRVPQNGKSS